MPKDYYWLHCSTCKWEHQQRVGGKAPRACRQCDAGKPLTKGRAYRHRASPLSKQRKVWHRNIHSERDRALDLLDDWMVQQQLRIQGRLQARHVQRLKQAAGIESCDVRTEGQITRRGQ